MRFDLLALTPLRHPVISAATLAALEPPLFCAGDNVALLAI
jgi:hypothetical protein